MENIYLTGPNGSVANLGSWLRVDPGPDYGAKDVVQQSYSQNVIAEGGVLAFETEPIRRMTIPVLVPSGGISGLSLPGVEGFLHEIVRPGGTIDLQPDGVATGERVRFDILGGRVNHDPYNVRLNQVGRRYLSIELDTPPFGYMPTQILLASVPSMALPGAIAINAASILGDAPGWGRLTFGQKNPTQYAVPTTSRWGSDFLTWSLAAKPSLPFILDVANWNVPPNPATQNGADVFAPLGRNSVQAVVSPGVMWDPADVWSYTVASAQAAAYRGRHRLYAWFRLGPSGIPPYLVSGDVTRGGAALASAAPIATLLPAVSSIGPSGIGAWGPQASPMYQMLDLGEVSLPRIPSGPVTEISNIRIWVSPATTNPGVATPLIAFGGAMLVPLDGPNGVMPRGVAQPTISAQAAIDSIDISLDARSRQAVLRSNLFGVGFYPDDTVIAVDEARRYYRGDLPIVGASNSQLLLMAGVRREAVDATGPVVHPGPPAYGGAELYYTPRFRFLKGF